MTPTAQRCAPVRQRRDCKLLTHVVSGDVLSARALLATDGSSKFGGAIHPLTAVQGDMLVTICAADYAKLLGHADVG